MTCWIPIMVVFVVFTGPARGDVRVSQSPPPPAEDDPDRLPWPAEPAALAHFKNGNAAFRRAAANTDPAIQRAEYQDAAREYLAAVKTETKHHYTLYWNLGATYRALGEYTRATHFYQRFIEFAPDRYAARRVAAEDHIRTMAAEVDKSDALDIPDPNAGRDPKEQAPPSAGVGLHGSADVARDRPRWYADKVGWSLVGAGLAVSLVGAGFYQDSSSLFDQAADEDRQSVQADLEERARFRRGIGVGAGVAGIACLAAGVIKLAVNGSPTDATPRVGFTIGASSFIVHGSF